MARKKKTARRNTAKRKTAKRRATKKRGPVDLIISKARTKAASGINVSGEFYNALDAAVRDLISTAERRATDNGRKTLRPYDL